LFPLREQRHETLGLGLISKLRMSHGNGKNKGGNAKKVFHNIAILPQNRRL